jgi:hypothetical protein
LSAPGTRKACEKSALVSSNLELDEDSVRIYKIVQLLEKAMTAGRFGALAET